MPAFTKTITLQLVAASATGIAASQSGTANIPLTLSGALVSGVPAKATMDVARRVIITPAGDESAHTFTIKGTDRYGRVQSEILAGVANPTVAQSVKDYLTVTSITPNQTTTSTVTAGTSTVGSSDAYICDWVPNGNSIGAALIFGGTANVTVQEALDDFAPAWDLNNNPPNWFNDTNMASKSSNANGNLAGPFTMIRLVMNSGTAPVILKLITPFIGGAI